MIATADRTATTQERTVGYAWIITKDHLFDPADSHTTPDDNEVGTQGPSSATPADLARLAKGLGWVFKMYDDDGNLYYTGRLVVSGNTVREDAEAMFGPLWDFGTGNAGCTDIRWAWDNWQSA